MANTIGTPAKVFESSANVWRHFCETCGSPMAFEAEHYNGVIHLYAASLIDPNNYEPTFHVNYESKLWWLESHDE